MSSQIIAGYGLGAFYPPYLEKNIPSVLDAGWTTIMLGLFHPTATGDIHFNDIPVFVDGAYKGDENWVEQLSQLTAPQSGNGIEVIASFGGGSVNDFKNIQTIYDDNGNSFSGTKLEANISALVSTMKSVVQTIDMDAEDNYNDASFIAFCNMIVGLGLKITFCPYMNMSFWTGALQQMNAANPGSVTRFNLQCYSSFDSGNSPQQWADAITAAIPQFDTTDFIVAGARDSDLPAGVTTALAEFRNDACVGGGFIWNLDNIMNSSTEPPMADYVAAIQKGLSGT